MAQPKNLVEDKLDIQIGKSDKHVQVLDVAWNKIFVTFLRHFWKPVTKTIHWFWPSPSKPIEGGTIQVIQEDCNIQHRKCQPRNHVQRNKQGTDWVHQFLCWGAYDHNLFILIISMKVTIMVDLELQNTLKMSYEMRHIKRNRAEPLRLISQIQRTSNHSLIMMWLNI